MEPNERKLIAQVSAHVSWANTENRSARTAPARAALEAKFLAEAGGDPQRAGHLRKAYFARLALKSAQSRRKARENTAAAESAEAELHAIGGGAEPPGRQCLTPASGGSTSAETNSQTAPFGGDAA